MSIEFTSESELENEVDLFQQGPKYPTFAGKTYPLLQLQPREFEILLYFLYKKEIEKGFHANKFDTIKLMKGVGERGRDCILVHKNKNVGAIQGKRYGRTLTKPECAREIIKFCLHAIQDKELITDKANFTYYLISVEGFNEKAMEFLNDFEVKIIKDEEFEAWTNLVIKENETIIIKSFTEVKENLINLIESIKIEYLTGIDIDGKLKLVKEIIPIFFEVEKVASESMLDEKFKQYFDFTNDDDLFNIRQRLKDIPEERRMKLGMFSIYGYDYEFYRTIAKQKDLFMKMAELKSAISKKFIDYLRETIEKYQLIYISGLPGISPFTKQAIVPYLFGKYASQYQQSTLGDFFLSFINDKGFLEQTNTMHKVKAMLLKTGEAVLNKDFSSFEGEKALIEDKKYLSFLIHAGFTNVQEMSDRFDLDMVTLNPIIAQIENHIENIMPKNPTIILQESDAINSEDDLVNMLKAANEFN